ncbi:MAG: hypothetical protein ACI978_001535, partial [Oleispira sp.]
MRIQNTSNSKILGLAAILLAAFTSGCSDNDSNSNNGSADDNTAPTIISTNPNNNATVVAINNAIVATFSVSMDETTLTTDTFTVIADTEAALVGSVSLDATSNTASFTPTSNLTASTLYTATITTAVKSTTGESLASNYVWTFTSGTAEDVTAPTVSSTNPSDTETNIALNR